MLVLVCDPLDLSFYLYQEYPTHSEIYSLNACTSKTVFANKKLVRGFSEEDDWRIQRKRKKDTSNNVEKDERLVWNSI